MRCTDHCTMNAVSTYESVRDNIIEVTYGLLKDRSRAIRNRHKPRKFEVVKRRSRGHTEKPLARKVCVSEIAQSHE